MKKESGVDRHCLGCKYYCSIYPELYYCSYLIQTDKRRPCPPGKDCTVKEKGKPKKNNGYSGGI